MTSFSSRSPRLALGTDQQHNSRARTGVMPYKSLPHLFPKSSCRGLFEPKTVVDWPTPRLAFPADRIIVVVSAPPLSSNVTTVTPAYFAGASRACGTKILPVRHQTMASV